MLYGMRVCVCVGGACVKHLNRCKTYWFVLSMLLQGAQVWLWYLCQRRRPDVTVISEGDVPLTYLRTILSHWEWHAAKPRTPHITLYFTIPLTISTTKRVNTCLIPSPVSWRIHAKKWSRALVFVVRGRALHLVVAFHLALESRKCIL